MDGWDGIYINNSMGSFTHAYFSLQYAENLKNAACIYRHRQNKE
jgi:hypothetical protein